MKKKNYLSAVIFALTFTLWCLSAIPETHAQISYSQNFSSGSTVAGWANDGSSTWVISSSCPDANLNTAAMYSSLKDITTFIRSPKLTGSNGGPVEFKYNYRITRRSGPGTYGAPDTFGTINVQWATSDSGPWHTVKTIGRDHVPSTSCVDHTVRFTPPVGGEVYLRFEITCNSYGDTYYFYFDEFTVTQGPYCVTMEDITETACDSFVLNGNTYFQSGTYVDTLVNAAGCDSFLTLRLTIRGESSLTFLTDTACNSYDFNGTIYTQSGIYTDTLTKPSGCDSIVILDLTIRKAEAGTITKDGEKLVAEPADIWQWLDCDNNFAAIPGAEDKEFTPSSSGRYAVAVTIDGCADTSACIELIKAPSGRVGDMAAGGQKFRIYPNPAGDHAYIQTGHTQAEAIRIVRITGQVLQLIPVSQGQDRYRIDLSGYRPGLYFAEILHPGGTVKMKLIKQ